MLWYILFIYILVYIKGHFVANQRKYTIMSIHTQSNNEKKRTK